MKKLETTSKLTEEMDKLLSKYGNISGAIIINGHTFAIRHDGADEKYVKIMSWRVPWNDTVFEARRFYNRTEFFVTEENVDFESIESRFLKYMPIVEKWLEIELEAYNDLDDD